MQDRIAAVDHIEWVVFEFVKHHIADFKRDLNEDLQWKSEKCNWLPSIYSRAARVIVHRRCQPCSSIDPHPLPNSQRSGKEIHGQTVFIDRQFYLSHIDITSADATADIQDDLIFLEIQRLNEFLNKEGLFFSSRFSSGSESRRRY